MDCINWENFRNKAERISCVVYFEDEEFNEETYKETVRKMEFSIITKAIEENKKTLYTS